MTPKRRVRSMYYVIFNNNNILKVKFNEYSYYDLCIHIRSMYDYCDLLS